MELFTGLSGGYCGVIAGSFWVYYRVVIIIGL